MRFAQDHDHFFFGELTIFMDSSWGQGSIFSCNQFFGEIGQVNFIHNSVHSMDQETTAASDTFFRQIAVRIAFPKDVLFASYGILILIIKAQYQHNTLIINNQEKKMNRSNQYGIGIEQAKHSNQRRSNHNAARALELEQAMYESRSRHLILVLTLSYKPEHQNAITLDTLRAHRDQLLNNKRNNGLLQGMNGYVWKIEEGSNAGGLHLHIIIFYAGEHRADILIAQSIGEYWVNTVTRGMGSYWNSNGDKDKHAQYGHGIGTGQIDRNDISKRESLRKNLLYLAKNEQRVSKDTGSRHRMFGASQFPSRGN